MENRNQKILIVDDNEKNIQVVANVLAENNYDIDYALNGQDALNLINSYDFTLILLDIMMPGMDGFEVCKRIKNNPEKNEIPIIFLTAKTDVDSIQKAFDNGGVDYLNKPFNSKELLARVKTHVALKTSKDKLKDTNKWLEEKVAERTQELDTANKKLLELDKAKSQFINIISHEIRTPLNGIIGGLSLLKDSGLAEEAESLVGILDLSAARLEAFSKKALDISLFNLYHKKMLKLENVNINDYILEILNTLEDEKEGKEIYFNNMFNADVSTMKVDANYFYKCLYNIIHNAIKFSPDKSSITIETINKNHHLIINIKDEGIGFDNGFLINDVEAFNNKNHVDNSPGLGLFLSNKIIEAHGGYLENGNNPDKGAFVKIFIPA